MNGHAALSAKLVLAEGLRDGMQANATADEKKAVAAAQTARLKLALYERKEERDGEVALWRVAVEEPRADIEAVKLNS